MQLIHLMTCAIIFMTKCIKFIYTKTNKQNKKLLNTRNNRKINIGENNGNFGNYRLW